MKQPLLISLCIISFSFLNTACNNNSDNQNKVIMPQGNSIKTQDVNYMSGNIILHGYVAYDSANSDERPVVVVVPEWWGVTDYVKRRARKLAELGYLAIVADIYGNGEVANNPSEAQKYAAPFYKNPQLGKERFDAALQAILKFPQADPKNIAAIGYCFGGGIVLNAARLGEDINGVVSFHGNLLGAPANKKLLKAKILVCQGEADKFVTPADVAEFKKQMDSIGADYTFKSYPNATHAFTNPDATEIGKKFSMPIEYNAAADAASWEDMQNFFKKIFTKKQ